MHKAQDAPAGGQRVSRTAAVLLATGSFAMLVGAVFLLPFLLSVRAEQNDVFFSNLFIGPVFFAIGSTLLVGSLAGLGLKGWITYSRTFYIAARRRRRVGMAPSLRLAMV